jgi:DNA-binding MarR family transcriptional regulator
MTASLIHLLHNAGQAADAAFAAAVGDDAITPRQCAVLIAIRDAKALPSQTYLVSATGIDRSTMADIVRRLVSRKLVTRRRTREDTRAYAVALTAEGRRVAAAAEKAAAATDRALVQRLPRDVRGSLVDTLRTIAEVAAMPGALAQPIEAAE